MRLILNTDPLEMRFCDECKAQGFPVVEVGEEPDYEAAYAHICLACLRKAVALAEASPP